MTLWEWKIRRINIDARARSGDARARILRSVKRVAKRFAKHDEAMRQLRIAAQAARGFHACFNTAVGVTIVHDGCRTIRPKRVPWVD